MKKILLSIKPEYADKIFSGAKKYEFRKSIFKDKDVKTVVVYASSPVQKVIGEFSIEDILSGTPSDIWETTCSLSGITQDFFCRYYANREKAFAIKIGNTKRYRKEKKLSDYDLLYAPQSFVYLK